MSQLFNNYTNEYTGTPDNTTEPLNVYPGYDEVIVLGADNTHCITFQHQKQEIKAVTVLYTQGIHTKLVFTWDEELNQEDNYASPIHWDSADDEYPARISYDISAEQTKLFNGYNQDVYCQASILLKAREDDPDDPDDNPIGEGTDITPIYKIHIEQKLEGESANE